MKRRHAVFGVAILLIGVSLTFIPSKVLNFGRRIARRVERSALGLDTPQPRERKNTPEGLSVWIVDEAVKVRPGDPLDEPVSTWPTSVDLQAARGETVSFQLVLASPSPLALDVVPGDLNGSAGKLESSAIEVFFEAFLDTPATDPTVVGLAPGQYPDPLIPLRDPTSGRAVASPVQLSARRNQPLWVDLLVPETTRPGAYQGVLRIVPRDGAERLVNLQLEVMPFAIPARRHLFAWVPLYATRLLRREGLGDEPAIAGYAKLLHSYHRMAHAHRFWTQVIDDQPQVSWDESSGTPQKIDWTRYDAVNGPVLDGSLFQDREPPPQWKVGGFVWWGARPGDPPNFGGNYQRDAALTPAHRTAIRKYMQAFRTHFNEKGWSHPSLFAYMVDEPDLTTYPNLLSLVADYGRALHDSGASVDHLVTVAPRPEWFGSVDIWATWGGGYVPSQMAQRQRAGNRTWFYQHHEPFVGGNCINNDGLAMTTWPWIAWRYRVDGIFLWVGNFWGEDPYHQAMNWNDELLGNGILFYPGHLLPTIGFPAVDGPISSFRMKALRRGMFDYEYFTLLREAGGDPDSVVRGVVRSALNEPGVDPPWRHPRWELPGDWSHDAAAWRIARREIARQLLARLGKAP